MTDKEKLEAIRAEIHRLVDIRSYDREMANDLFAFMDSLPNEPVSEDLKVELNKYIKDHFTIDTEQLDRFGIEEKDYMYSMDKSDILALVEHFTNLQKTKEESVSEKFEEALAREWQGYTDRGAATVDALEDNTQELAFAKGFYRGAKWQKSNLWKPADGDDLPEIDREVVVLYQPYPLENNEYAVSFAHRPSKNLLTDEIEHYTPETYDKGGWNIPDVIFWLDCNLPKKIIKLWNLKYLRNILLVDKT